jgi:hypothetical protein
MWFRLRRTEMETEHTKIYRKLLTIDDSA